MEVNKKQTHFGTTIHHKIGRIADDRTTANRETSIRSLEEVWESPNEVSDKVKAMAAYALSRLGTSEHEKNYATDR